MDETQDGAEADLDSSEEQLYFLAIEKVFLEERGSPLCLSPKDWHLARSWHDAGVPLDWVERTLRELFEKRRAKGTVDKVVNLSYCKRSVEAAWKRYQKMRSPEVEEAMAIDVASRLAALARSLPGDLADRDGWAERLSKLEGSPEQVEGRLEEIDRELLESARADLDPERHEEIRRQVAKALANLARRLPAEELSGVEEQLTERILREQLGLPVLSLFAVEATSDCESSAPDPEV